MFYAWGEPVYLLLMLAVAAQLGVRAAAGKKKTQQGLALALCVALNLASLVVFKYAGFLVENCNALFGVPGPPQISRFPSAFRSTFRHCLTQSMCTEKTLRRSGLTGSSACMFRCSRSSLRADCPLCGRCGADRARELDSENIFRGVTRFCIGLGKKVLLADHIGQVADQLLGGLVSRRRPRAASGSACSPTCSDLFRFLRLFRHGHRSGPHLRLPIHGEPKAAVYGKIHHRILAALAHFAQLVLPDYVYIPLGGNRACLSEYGCRLGADRAVARGELELVLWGLYFFVILAAEKTIGEKAACGASPRSCAAWGTMLLVPRLEHLLLLRTLDAAAAALRRFFGCLRARAFPTRRPISSFVNNLPLHARLRDRRDVGAAEFGNLFGGRSAGGKREADRLRLCDVRV